jgi:hypothetical protein
VRHSYRYEPIGNEPLAGSPREPRTRGARSTATSCGFAAAPCAGEFGSPLFFEHILEDGAIKRQIGDDCLEFGVLIAQLAKLADFGGTKASKAFLPDIERRLRDTELARDICDRRTDLGLAQCSCDLFVGVAGFAHGANLLAGDKFAVFSSFPRDKKSGVDPRLLATRPSIAVVTDAITMVGVAILSNLAAPIIQRNGFWSHAVLTYPAFILLLLTAFLYTVTKILTIREFDAVFDFDDYVDRRIAPTYADKVIDAIKKGDRSAIDDLASAIKKVRSRKAK